MVTSKTAPTAKVEPFRKQLTSASANLHIGDWQLSYRDLELPGARPWSVRKYTLRGGKQEGVDAIDVDNGNLRFTLTPTRGMGVVRVEMGQVRLGWDSPVREVVHPKFVNLPSRGGLGWLDGFNEFLVRCGLESMGAPGPDTFRTATGAEATSDLTLHGKIANIPASEVEVLVDRTPPHRLRVRGRVDERMMLGPHFELWTEISTELGSNQLRVEDCVRNASAVTQEFQLLYHVNFGPPLLEAGARFRGAFNRVTPANEHSAKHVEQFDTYASPVAGFSEQVYFCEPLANERGCSQVLLHNAAADQGVSMAFATDQLPCFTLWKHTGAMEDGYVTGLEPGTSFPNPRQIEREAGRVPQLRPGEGRTFAMDFAIHVGETSVSTVRSEIDWLQRL